LRRGLGGGVSLLVVGSELVSLVVMWRLDVVESSSSVSMLLLLLCGGLTKWAASCRRVLDVFAFWCVTLINLELCLVSRPLVLELTAPVGCCCCESSGAV
jgi:hypothetical protein